MRTLDPNFLKNNPAGDVKAKFQVTSLIPEGAKVPMNPDGSRPQVTIDVEANTWMNGLSALGSLENFSENPEMVTWIEQIATDAEIEKVNNAKNDKRRASCWANLLASSSPSTRHSGWRRASPARTGSLSRSPSKSKLPPWSSPFSLWKAGPRASHSRTNTAMALCSLGDDDDSDNEYDGRNDVLVAG